MIAIPTLTDGVVTLRAPNDTDIEGSVEQCQDPLSQRWTTAPVPYTPDDARRYLRHVIPDGWESDREWGFVVEAVDETGTGRFAGSVSLRNRDDGRAEIAYGAHPWARGRGVMQRALRLLLDWGFAERDLHSVVWLAERGNWASRRLAWKVGFDFGGTLRDWLPQRGELADAWTGTLLRGEELAPRTPWFEVPRVTGSRVVLRRHRDDDAARVQEGCSDEQTAYWLGFLPQPYTLEDAHEFLSRREEAMATGSALHWMMADPETDECLGAVSLILRGPGLDAEVGYWGHPAARGRGLMTEAVGMAVRHAFIPVEDGGLGYPRVTGYAATDNLASRRVMEANGFHLTGVERLAADVRDGRHDLAGYDLLATELVATD